MGESLSTLQQALKELGRRAGPITACSSLYRTRPWGNTAQPDFLNAACQLDTSLSPAELLRVMQEIELAHGRRRLVHWGPRTLDLDIIDYAGAVSHTKELTLPHPRALERAFVLVPLFEIVPDYIFAAPKISVAQALSGLKTAWTDEVVKIDGKLL